jgi:predicted DNA-binding transcriptional regulator YafY
MGYVKGRKDRTARLLNLQFMLYQSPQGLNVKEIASKCSVCERTVYRDLKSLDSELGIPIWLNKGKYGINEGHFLPPIHFTLIEAASIFISARLIQQSFPIFHQGIASAFLKLNTIVPEPLKQRIRNTLEYMEKQTKDTIKINNFNKFIQAWLSQRQVKIKYLNTDGDNVEETIIDPYFIEPSTQTRSSYIIGYCHNKKSIRSFKMSRVLGEVIICPEKYKIPSDFNPLDYLRSAWGVHTEYTDNDLSIVKLQFSPKRRGIKETFWHPSQKIEEKRDGSIIMTLRVRNTNDFRSWILGWGGDVKVIKPKKLRNQIIEHAQSVLSTNDYC